MSSFDGDTLEEWVEEMYLHSSATKEQLAAIVALHEPYREDIENSIKQFHEQEGDGVGWRSWYTSAFYWIPNEIDEKASTILKSSTPETEKDVYMKLLEFPTPNGEVRTWSWREIDGVEINLVTKEPLTPEKIIIYLEMMKQGILQIFIGKDV